MEIWLGRSRIVGSRTEARRWSHRAWPRARSQVVQRVVKGLSGSGCSRELRWAWAEERLGGVETKVLVEVEEVVVNAELVEVRVLVRVRKSSESGAAME